MAFRVTREPCAARPPAGTGSRSPALRDGDGGRPGAHPLDRPEPEPGDEVAEAAGERERERSADQQLAAYGGDGLVGVLALDGEDDDLVVDRS